MGYIQFGEIRNEHFYLIILFIVYLLNLLFYSKNTEIFSEDPFIICLSMFTAEMIGGIFIPISRYLNKSELKDSSLIKDKIKKENNNYNINQAYGTFIFVKEEFQELFPNFNLLIIIFLSLIDFSNTLFTFYSDEMIYALNSEVEFFNLIFIFGLSYFILDFRIFLHHKVMIFFIVFLAIFIDVIDYLRKGSQKITWDNIIGSFQIIIGNVFNIFIPVTEKYLMDKNHCSPFKILFFCGFLGFLLTFIYSFFHHLIITDGFRNLYESLYENILINNFSNFFYLVLLSFLLNFFTILTCKFLHPTHMTLVSYSSKPMFKILNFLFFGQDKKISNYLILMYISYFILIFCCLVFNEFIILNFCGLNEFTKLGIANRAEEETNKISCENEESLSSNAFTNTN